MLCIAHRGGRGLGTENALATIEQSLALGVDGIEIDVWEIQGELLVTHDRELGRVIQGQGRLYDITKEQLTHLRHVDNSPVATLQQVLDLVGTRALINVELKGPRGVELLAQVLQNHHRQSGLDFANTVVSSFDHQQLLWLKQHAPQLRRGALYYGDNILWATVIDILKPFSINIDLDFFKPATAAMAQAQGIHTWVYTVNDERDFLALKRAQVSGVFTDYPNKLQKFLAEQKKT